MESGQIAGLVAFAFMAGAIVWWGVSYASEPPPDPHSFGWDREARNYVLAAIYCSWCGRHYTDKVHRVLPEHQYPEREGP
jgi:hypothetical protein